jgi:hypothetical protein
MTIDTIVAGASRTYTAFARGQSFAIANNSGQFGRITELVVNGQAATEPGIGPQPERRTIGPLLVGDGFKVTCDSGQLLVEYDNLVTGGDVSQAEFDSLAGTVSGHSTAISSLQSSQTAQDVTISGLSGTVGTLSPAASRRSQARFPRSPARSRPYRAASRLSRVMSRP